MTFWFLGDNDGGHDALFDAMMGNLVDGTARLCAMEPWNDYPPDVKAELASDLENR